MPRLNREFGDGATIGAADNMTEAQRLTMKMRDAARAKARAWDAAADELQCAMGAERSGDALTAARYLYAAERVVARAEALPLPAIRRPCSRCGEPILNTGPHRCERCYTD